MHGLDSDNGKEHGNYYMIIGYIGLTIGLLERNLNLVTLIRKPYYLLYTRAMVA